MVQSICCCSQFVLWGKKGSINLKAYKISSPSILFPQFNLFFSFIKVTQALQNIWHHTFIMNTQTIWTCKIEESEAGQVNSRGDSGSSSATDAIETPIILLIMNHNWHLHTENNDIDQEMIMSERVQQQSVESQKNTSLSSIDSIKPTSPVQAICIWELKAHSSVCCEKSTAKKAIHIIFFRNPLNLQPSRSVVD